MVSPEDRYDFDNHEVLSSSLRAIDEGLGGSPMCFLCGGSPSGGKGEHIFPKWLQRKHNLWDETLNLLNGTTIPYRDLTSPCCVQCNTKILSTLERDVRNIVFKNNIMDDEAKFKLGIWSFKILIGILFTECRLKNDLKDPRSDSIFPLVNIKDIRHIHMIINSIRKEAYFNCIHDSKVPFTIYRYKIKELDDVPPYNFSTNLPGQSVAMRVGNVGWVAIADGGLQHEIGPKGPYQLVGQELHPLQFDELAARIHYKSFLRCATHFYVTSETPEFISMMQLHVTPYHREIHKDGSFRTFDDWDEMALSNFIENYTNSQNVYHEYSGFCKTIVVDENHKLRKIT